MGIPTSEVGYTSAMPRREDHKVHKDMWGHWGGLYIYIYIFQDMDIKYTNETTFLFLYLTEDVK